MCVKVRKMPLILRKKRDNIKRAGSLLPSIKSVIRSQQKVDQLIMS